MPRCPAKTGTTGEEYIRFWVHALECTCKLADDNGASTLSPSYTPCMPLMTSLIMASHVMQSV